MGPTELDSSISFLEKSVRNLIQEVVRLGKRIEDLERERRPSITSIPGSSPAACIALNSVYVLFQETSDQYGTSEMVGVYSTKELALLANETITTKRTYIKCVPFDQPPAKSDRDFKVIGN